VAKKIFYIFILTILTGILIFCIAMMIKYYKLSKKENNTDTPSVLSKIEENTPTDADKTGTAKELPVSSSSAATPSPTPSPAPTSDPYEQFTASVITDDIFNRIKGKSYPEGATVSLDDLRYLKVLHYGFDGEIHEGELIVNHRIADDVLSIFKELFDIKYPIEKIRLIDEYDANDEASMEDNNSSAFCYRVIAESTTLSNHALGLAIDINTLYNPYVYTRKDGTLFLQPENAGDYVDRDVDNPYYIKKGDACYNIFIKYGFTWGGDWNTKKDYQHFEKPLD